MALTLEDLALIAQPLTGVRRSGGAGRSEWRYHGRLVAREIDGSHVVIRAEFEARRMLLRQHPETFSVPPRFEKHMMVVCDLGGDAGAIEDALHAAWELQRRR
jgi:hypothetical protein